MNEMQLRLIEMIKKGIFPLFYNRFYHNQQMEHYLVVVKTDPLARGQLVSQGSFQDENFISELIGCL